MDLIFENISVIGHKDQVFQASLGDQHPVERIPVMRRKAARGPAVPKGHG